MGFITGMFTVIGSIYGAVNYFADTVGKKEINGEWKLTFYIESSTLKRYIGKSSGNRIVVTTDNEKFKAKGERWWVDDVEIPYSEHDIIEFEGQLKGSDLTATYTLYGQKRTSVGSIKMKVVNNDSMFGSFTGTAANTSGKATAVRLQ